MDRFEFLSAEWLAAVRVIVERLVAQGLVDVSDVEFTVSEELTDPPVGLAHEGSGTVGWFLRFSDGAVEVGAGPCAEANVHVVADYDTHHDLSRRPWAGDTGAMATSARLRKEAISAGRLRVQGDLAHAPDAVRDLIAGLHDPVANITE